MKILLFISICPPPREYVQVVYTPILSNITVLILECNLPIIISPPLHFLLVEKPFLTGAFSKPNRFAVAKSTVKGLCLCLLLHT